MSDEFYDPGEATNVDWRELSGRLLLIYPTEKLDQVPTREYGEKEAIRARIVVLDGPNAPRVMNGCLVFPLYLQGQLRDRVGTGKAVLGRLGGGALTGTREEKAWKLAAANDSEKDTARKWIANPVDKATENEVPF